MNDDERIAERFLNGLFTNVHFEPLGVSKAPDFRCDVDVSVEVIGLYGQDVFGPGNYVLPNDQLHSIDRALSAIKEMIYRDFDTVPSMAIHMTLSPTSKCPVNSKHWFRKLLSVVEQHRAIGTPIEVEMQLEKGLNAVITVRASETLSFSHLINGGAYFSQDLYIKHINHALEKKSKGLASYGDKYQHNWLIIIDLFEEIDSSDSITYNDLVVVTSEAQRFERLLMLSHSDGRVTLDLSLMRQ